jgi:hypothetical protein
MQYGRNIFVSFVVFLTVVVKLSTVFLGRSLPRCPIMSLPLSVLYFSLVKLITFYAADKTFPPHFYYGTPCDRIFLQKAQGLKQSRRTPLFMELDSLLCSQKGRTETYFELIHTVDVHLSSDFVINFLSFFPRCTLVSYAASSKFCNPSVVQTVISIIPRTCASYFFSTSFFNPIYFSKGQFVKFITMHLRTNYSYLVQLSYKYCPLCFIFKHPQSVFFIFNNERSNKCL